MNTELYMENYRLDVDPAISALLNFALADIKDFSARSTTWSKTIVLPGTTINNQAFGHIFQVGQANFHDPAQDNVGYNFNAAKSADCIIFQEQVQTFIGVLRLMQVNIYKGRIEYEVSVFGKLAGLNVSLSGGLLEDLDFSLYDHVYNGDNVIDSWANPGGSGVYYPLIDYGTYSTDKHDWDIRTFRPALYVKEYIDKMFDVAGYRYSADMFDTERILKLIIPHNAKILTASLTRLYEASINTPQFIGNEFASPDVVAYPFYTGGSLVHFDVLSGSGFTPNVDKTVYTYSGTATSNITVPFTFSGTYEPLGIVFLEFYISKNGDGNPIYQTGLPLSTTPFTISGSVTGSFAPGDTIEFRFLQRVTGTGSSANFILSDAQWSANSAGGAGIPVPINVGDTVQVNDAIPKNFRQIDFLVGIVKLFNLYVYEDKFDPSLIHIEPYITFYTTNQSESVDWTYKLDRNQAMKVKPMSELTAKVYNFKFKPDSDYYNELYRKRYSQGYGDRIYDSQFEFAEQTKEFEIIFSSTPLVGYGGEEKIYPTIFKRTGPDNAPVEENVDSNIRILQSKRIVGLTNAWQIKDGSAVINQTTQWGYAGHFNDPDAPNDDLNFGATRELFFVLATGNLSNNQFNVYWSGYMAEITDKDSKLLTGKFYLTPADIAKLDFSKYIYLDGCLFRLNSIKDYNASKPSTCTVELLKVNELNFTEATPPDGPPEGNYLLWSNDNIMYFDDETVEGNELLWRDDNTSAMNYDFDHLVTGFSISQSFKIFVNAVEVVSSGTSINSTLALQVGDIVQVTVTASGLAILKRFLEVSSDVDGALFSSGPSIGNKSFTWTVLDARLYTVNASVTI